MRFARGEERRFSSTGYSANRYNWARLVFPRDHRCRRSALRYTVLRLPLFLFASVTLVIFACGLRDSTASHHHQHSSLRSAKHIAMEDCRPSIIEEWLRTLYEPPPRKRARYDNHPCRSGVERSVNHTSEAALPSKLPLTMDPSTGKKRDLELDQAEWQTV
jgi:hypothetical protein